MSVQVILKINDNDNVSGPFSFVIVVKTLKTLTEGKALQLLIKYTELRLKAQYS